MNSSLRHFIWTATTTATVFIYNAQAKAFDLCLWLKNKPSIACEFLVEKGHYKYSEHNLVDYYSQNEITKNFLKLKIDLNTFYQNSKIINAPDIVYKINGNNEFQAKNWFSYSEQLVYQQQRWEIQIPQFIHSQKQKTFNEAKRALFAQYPFSMTAYRSLLPYPTMAEWGGLSHPPIQESQIKNLQDFSTQYAPIPENDPRLVKSKLLNSQFQKQLDKITQSEMTAGNSFHLLADSQSFESKLNLIKQAKKSIWISSLVFVDDETTSEIVRALQDKARAGLDVKVITENALSYVHPQQIKRMKSLGVQVLLADDFFKYNTQAIYHSKVFIVDQNQAIIGGQNMIDADLGSHGTDLKNRDLDVLITGPVVTDIQANFIEDWNHFLIKNDILKANRNLISFSPEQELQIENLKQSQRQSGLRGHDHYSQWLSNSKTRMKGLGRWVAQKPYKNMNTITDTYIELLNSAQNYLGITNPQAIDAYTSSKKEISLSPIKDVYTNFNRLYQNLQNILKSKPEVQIDYLTSGERFVFNEAVPMTLDRIKRYLQTGQNFLANVNQKWLDEYSLKYAKPQYENLMKDFVPYSQVQVWLHISFIHTKVLYVDRILASLGSFNLHHNASDHAYESTLLMLDQEFNQQLDQAMIYDMANSNPFIYSKVNK